MKLSEIESKVRQMVEESMTTAGDTKTELKKLRDKLSVSDREDFIKKWRLPRNTIIDRISDAVWEYYKRASEGVNSRGNYIGFAKGLLTEMTDKELLKYFGRNSYYYHFGDESKKKFVNSINIVPDRMVDNSIFKSIPEWAINKLEPTFERFIKSKDSLGIAKKYADKLYEDEKDNIKLKLSDIEKDYRKYDLKETFANFSEDEYGIKLKDNELKSTYTIFERFLKEYSNLSELEAMNEAYKDVDGLHSIWYYD